MALMLLQQFSGINSIIYFTVFIFQKAGSTLDKNVATIVSLALFPHNFMSIPSNYVFVTV